ncbi:UDP-4-amino-4,6-dideoxy-N-acetyl-beta-L-altrosamine transaminase [Alteromonas aestuariivivens]|uniref:UDP-4-amino-4, 6-dideoxy-N-acetyl-beta-L-altrosamine transaminase n=1 Tax=Alteromonas aestuariivivens TaxID=1938339 RepID=A0A3D8M686_9ALTE|nr:UDP-4-amino-4,6-dideoxy-N-acetyl-beta-L-altrosamine transaminase [Alteromonas aestuariivivens]RDV25044.1 UDP-4-amino-4,6-dideoxy-N-acetyl-beta-L-altrosamine transaminase [Alteromonas aestuariivivens]
MIPYGKHTINDEDVNAVVSVLKNEFLTQGNQVPEFEQSLCEYTGANHAIAVNSGTSGLHLSCLAAGVKEGDIVWTSPNSFAASANCALYCGAEVEFIDIDPLTRNICLIQLAQKLDEALRANRLPKAIIAVHFAGSSCDMKAIATITRQYGIVLIEDAAHGFGGKDPQGCPIGEGKHSDFVVLSFHPVKSMTTAEGGAVLTNDKRLADTVRLYASHGITRDTALFPSGEQQNPWFYSQQSLGFNYRLSDLHAALGNSQIRRLDDFIAQRKARAQVYHDALVNLPVVRPVFDNYSAWHLYVIELEMHDRKTVFEVLRSAGIGVNVHYIPIYRHHYYKSRGFAAHNYPNCERYYQNALTLPLFPGLTADMQEKVISTLQEALM